MQQLTMLGGKHNEQFAPYAAGDILQTKPFGRVIVESTDENLDGQVMVCVSLVDGRTCVVLAREVEYRSKG